MPKSTVYVETSIVSYLTALGSRDLVRAAHQELTRSWWESRDSYALFASQLVIDEASAGDLTAANRRLPRRKRDRTRNRLPADLELQAYRQRIIARQDRVYL